MSGTTALLVNVANIYYCINKKWPSRKLDYKKLYTSIETEIGPLKRAIAYGYQVNDEAQNFISCLRAIGFDISYEKIKIKNKNETDQNKMEYRRPNQNVQIAMDAVRLIEKVDTIVIGSSESDLVPLIRWLKDKGIRCIVIGVGISRELKDISNRYIEISNLLLEEEVVNEEVINEIAETT